MKNIFNMKNWESIYLEEESSNKQNDLGLHENLVLVLPH